MSARIELDRNFVVFGPPVGARVVILLNCCGRHGQLNDYRPMNSSGMVAHPKTPSPPIRVIG